MTPNPNDESSDPDTGPGEDPADTDRLDDDAAESVEDLETDASADPIDVDTPADADAIPESDADDGTVDYEVSSSDRTWGVLVHAAAFVGLVVPFGNILAPLIIWAIKKEDSRFVDDNGKQAINFQITWTVLLFLVGLTIFIVIGLVLVPLVALAWVILVIIAIIRASNEKVYDYPLTLDLIS